MQSCRSHTYFSSNLNPKQVNKNSVMSQCGSSPDYRRKSKTLESSIKRSDDKGETDYILNQNGTMLIPKTSK